jgi:hypothetical protein
MHRTSRELDWPSMLQHAVLHFKKHKPAYVLRCSRHLEQQNILECSQGNVIHENWNLSSATLRVIAVQVLAAGIICETYQ